MRPVPHVATQARPSTQPSGALLGRPAAGDTTVHSPRTEVLRAPEHLTAAERQAGLHLNRITTTLAGNSHFPNWWDVVPNDTSIVVAQGSAYHGQTVEVGHERYENAQIIYLRPRAGLREQTHLDVKGAAGEQVRVLYYRVGPNARLETQGVTTRVLDAGQSASIGGDPHWRDVRLTIQPTASEHAIPVPTFFDYYHPDHYDRTAQQAGRDTRGPKGRNELGGDATEDKATQRVIDPMFH
jgi:hypothetical protein